jgi:hypothetical protein
MRKTTILALVLTLMSMPTVSEAQTPPRGDRPRAEAAQERRAQLEEQVNRQFMVRATERLGLDQRQQARLEQVLEEGMRSRRALAGESRQLRMELMQAVRSADTPPTTFERILARMATLREREQQLASREDAALAEFLDPRQRAMFLVLRMQMTEQVRGMRGARPGGPRNGGPGL